MFELGLWTIEDIEVILMVLEQICIEFEAQRYFLLSSEIARMESIKTRCKILTHSWLMLLDNSASASDLGEP
jgi:hypothetical protein